MEIKYPLARIIGNAGMFFVTPYVGSAIAGIPSFDVAGWSAVIGLVISTSRELIEYGKVKEGFNDTK